VQILLVAIFARDGVYADIAWSNISAPGLAA